MKKLLFLLIAFVAVLGVQAQNNYAGSSRFTDNWSLGIEGGIQTNLHDWNAPQGGLAGISINKELTPLFGVTFEAFAGVNNVANWLHHPTHFHNGNLIDNTNYFADARLNLTNAFLMYKGKPRFFEIEALGGIGYGHVYAIDNVDGGKGQDQLLAKAGLKANINFSRVLTLSVKPAVVWDITNKRFDSKNAVGQLTATLIYHFKTSNGKRYMQKYDIAALLEENASLQAQLADKSNYTAPVTNTETVVVEKTVNVPVRDMFVVCFAKGSAELSAAAKDILNAVGNNAVVDVKAYASPDGTAEFNQKLSQDRADAVKAYLTERGVRVNSAEGKGVDGETSNRIAIVTYVGQN